jgi:hypothetical protein
MTEMEQKGPSVESEMRCGLELQQDYKPCFQTAGSLMSLESAVITPNMLARQQL